MILIVIGSALFMIGVGGSVFPLHDEAIILAGLGMTLFVIGAWRAVHPAGFDPMDSWRNYGDGWGGDSGDGGDD